MPPFFTIITSTYNAAATLPRLLDSLASQTCRDFNWIVKDGASLDSTMQIVEQYRDRLPEVLANSGKDRGIYDAWNKVLERWGEKMGDWVLFLGADDMLAADTVLDDIKKELIAIPDQVIFYAGKLNIIDYKSASAEGYLKKTSHRIRFSRRFFDMPFQHPALFQRKHVLLQHKFDPTFKIAGDYDFILRSWKIEEQARESDMLVTYMALNGISTAPQFRKKCHQELLRVIRKNLQASSIRGVKRILILLNTYFFEQKNIVKKYIPRRIIDTFFFCTHRLYSVMKR